MARVKPENLPDADGTLFCDDRQMDPEPKNGTLSLFAALLAAGETVYVNLQPGDGTRYNLMLVPLWAAHLGTLKQDWSPECWQDTLYVLNVTAHDDVTGCTTTYASGNYGAVLSTAAKGYEWTARIIEWWLEFHLWPRIRAVRGAGRT